MKRRRFSEAQIIGMSKEAEAELKKQQLCRKHGAPSRRFTSECLSAAGCRRPTRQPGSGLSRLSFENCLALLRATKHSPTRSGVNW